MSFVVPSGFTITSLVLTDLAIKKNVDRIRPFINKNKQAVHAAYQAHDMMEQLYPYTYSCETVPEDYSTMDFVHCGHCFFCLERYWGFGRIV